MNRLESRLDYVIHRTSLYQLVSYHKTSPELRLSVSLHGIVLMDSAARDGSIQETEAEVAALEASLAAAKARLAAQKNNKSDGSQSRVGELAERPKSIVPELPCKHRS